MNHELQGFFETISHNCLTKIKKHCLFKIDFQKEKKKKIKLAYTTFLLTNAYKGHL